MVALIKLQYMQDWNKLEYCTLYLAVLHVLTGLLAHAHSDQDHFISGLNCLFSEKKKNVVLFQNPACFGS